MTGRVGAARTPEAFARVLGMYAGACSLLWLLICMFGTVAVLATGTLAGGDVLQSFVMRLASLQNDVADAASWMLLASMIAMAVLTMSAMFSATLATIRYDIVPTVWPNLAPGVARSTDLALAEKTRRLCWGGARLAMLVTLIFLIDYPDGLYQREVPEPAVRVSLRTASTFSSTRLGSHDRRKALPLLARPGQSRCSRLALPRGRAW